MTLKTKYGEIKIVEDTDGKIVVHYDTDCDVMVQVNSTNTVTFHTVQPRINKDISQE